MTKTQETTADLAHATDTFALIHPGLLVPDPRNVRDELTDIDSLAASIFQLGLQQPLRVRFVPHGFIENDPTCAVYVVIAGHRRLAAVRSLIEQELWDGDVPCMIAPDTISSDDVTAAMLVENLQRSDLNPVEEAKAFDRLTKEFRYKRPELAAKIGRSESYVADRLALLKLPESIQQSISVGHYPLSHALLLKGVAHDVVEVLTNGGRRVIADPQTISTAVTSAKYSELKQALERAIATAGFETVVEGRFQFIQDSELVAEFHTLDEAKLLAKYDGAPRGTKAVVNDSPYARTIHVELRKPLTAKQLEKRAADAAAKVSAEQSKRDQEKAERYEQERAGWSDEYRAWVDQCEAAKAEHVAAVAAHEEAIAAAELDWTTRVDAKLVAKWAMLAIIGWTSTWELVPIARQLGLDVSSNDVEDALHAYVIGDAKKLVQVVAMCLALDEGSDFAIEDRDRFVKKLNIPDVPELVLPDEPTDDKEDDADDPIHDIA